ncbi:MAG: CDP-2,3-bis-(O-geranylgeranyl)-sn-glycerol synthase [Nanoarchaeota archaeon]|nr:CDP-2,3-bis-(O-geranylgeranyl)-sn-glycerol synthase [Nanoarchaeota archaeon]
MDWGAVFTIYTLVEAIWIILPAYAANGLVPLARGKHPVDGGLLFRGKPLLGPGKTWEGWIFGTLIGAVIGTIQMLAFPYVPFWISDVPLTIVPMSPVLGAVLGFGAICGDMVSSFFKRRINLIRGAAAPVLDQDNFIVGSLVFVALVVLVKLEWAILLLIITPLVHWAACYIGYKLKVKQTPW